MMRRHTCLEFLSHRVVTYAGSWSCTMPFGMRVWRVSVADKNRKFRVRRDWDAVHDVLKALQAHRSNDVLSSTSRWSCLGTAFGLSHRCYTCNPLKMIILARLHPSGRGHTQGRLVISSRGLTWTVSLSICILYWRPWEFENQRNIHVEGWCVCSGRVFLCRTGLVVFYLSVRFPSWRRVRLVDMCALKLFGVLRQFSIPLMHTLYPYIHGHRFFIITWIDSLLPNFLFDSFKSGCSNFFFQVSVLKIKRFENIRLCDACLIENKNSLIWQWRFQCEKR